MKLHRDLGVTQKTAWFMLHRIRETWGGCDGTSFAGPVEVEEAYFGGLRKNMSNERRKELEGTGRGPVGKTAVVAAKDRETKQVAARVIERTDRETLGGFVDEHASEDATLYTDDATAYRGSGREHETIRHSAQEYVQVPGGRESPHERRGILLVDVEARPQGHVPPPVREAPTALRQRVRRPAQHP